MSFSGEEEGLLGSKYYVNNPVWPLEKTVAMINLDMVGRLKDDKLNIGGIGTASEWRELVAKANDVGIENGTAAADIDLKNRIEGGLQAEKLDGVQIGVRDNQVTMYAARTTPYATVENVISAVTETKPGKLILRVVEPPFALQLNEDGYGPSDHSSFYSKKIPVLFFFTGTHVDYHKPSDTSEKINYDGEQRLINYVSEIVRALDRNPTRPTYTVAKSSGTTGGRAAFNVSLGTIPSYGDTTDGMVIDGVRDDSPASRAGLRAGDKIVKLAGKEVRNAMDYTFVLGTMKAGEEYEVEIIRGGEKMTMKIIPVKR
jgi:hypothetical protein